MFRQLESALDRVCDTEHNPLRQLGAMAFALFWLVALTGAYLYLFHDTSVTGAHASVERITHEQWWGGGVVRSLHRYASDALVAVVFMHLLREFDRGRFRGFRWYSWVSGIPALWLLLAAGSIGYWLVWDALALFVATTAGEWFGVLPGFGPELARNVIVEGAVSDRLFSLLMFLHIGLPLGLLLAMWMHLQRLTLPRTLPSRPVALASSAALLFVAIWLPAHSQAPADPARAVEALPLDWFFLAPLAAVDAFSPAIVWTAVIGTTLLLAIAPWLGGPARSPAARVDPANCNGCGLCFADCPYAAIAMAPHPGGRGLIAIVDDDRCAACGICAGACPSASPFRSGADARSGIDLSPAGVRDLHRQLEAALAARVGPAPGRANTSGPAPLVVFYCEHGSPPQSRAPSERIAFGLPCLAMLPPSFIDDALRRGARRVVLASCPPGDCEFRFGANWARERFAGERAPRLRAGVDRRSTRLVHPARRRFVVTRAQSQQSANHG